MQRRNIVYNAAILCHGQWQPHHRSRFRALLRKSLHGPSTTNRGRLDRCSAPAPFHARGVRMSRSTGALHRSSSALAAGAAAMLTMLSALTQVSPLSAQATTASQRLDQQYTSRIRQVLSDSRISTELIDHLPASATVPTPLKFLGHVIGEPGILD